MNNSQNQEIKIEINEVDRQILDNSDTDSIGSADDLIDQNNNKNNNNNSLLGFNLPTNDLTRSGQLDNISVDSYWINEEEIDDINKEKELNPVNPNYKSVYKSMIKKYTENQTKENENSESKQKSN
jgi:hypothetical protein